jgi:hypothetical protein
MREGVVQGGLISPVLFSLYVNDMPNSSHQVSPLCGRHGHHSHVPKADAARQLPGVLSQRRSTVAE